MVTPTTAMARERETSMDLVRIVGERETSMEDRLVVEGKATNMDLVSRVLEVPTGSAIRTRLEEEEDTASGLRTGGGGPGRMEVEAGARPTTGGEQQAPPGATGTPHPPTSTSTVSNPS